MAGERLKQPYTNHQDEQQRYQDVGGIGVHVPNLHPSRLDRETAQDVDRRLKNEAVDDMHFSVLAFDCGAEVNSDGLGTFLAGGRMQERSEDDPNRIGKSGRGIGGPGRKMA